MFDQQEDESTNTMSTNTTPTRKCVEPGCTERAKPKGKRGPAPLRCEVHTRKRKQYLDRHPMNPCSNRPECCADGLCPQHRDNREARRESRETDDTYKAAVRFEGGWLLGMLGEGMHIDRERMPLEGKADPVWSTSTGQKWREDNRGWEPEYEPGEGWPEPYEETISELITEIIFDWVECPWRRPQIRRALQKGLAYYQEDM